MAWLGRGGKLSGTSRIALGSSDGIKPFRVATLVWPLFASVYEMIEGRWQRWRTSNERGQLSLGKTRLIRMGTHTKYSLSPASSSPGLSRTE